MDKRSLLLGLGIGMIVGALLMQLFLVGEKSTAELQKRDDTINGSENISKQQPESTEDITNATKLETELATAKTNQPKQIEQEQGEFTQEEELPTTLLLKVNSGATVSQTAEVLFNYGIIENIQSFIDYTRSENERIRAGYFLVTKNTTYVDILNILTGTPLPEEEALIFEQNKTYELIFSP